MNEWMKRREFVHQRISDIFFRLEVMAVEVEIPVRAIFTIIITASVQLI